MNTKAITVNAQLTYNIQIKPGILNEVGSIVKTVSSAKKAALITHEHLYEKYGSQLEKSFDEAGIALFPLFIPVGESSKCFDRVHQILNHMFDHHLERQDIVIAFGGGVIGDLAGFVASLYLRGIKVLQVPTTVLAQVDASMGGKTGINVAYGKNLVGAFHQPSGVIIDPTVLRTLPEREMLCGLAEVVKYGVIMNIPLFEFLENNSTALSLLNYETHQSLWESCIDQSTQNKADIVQQDEKESGVRAFLNYGHTIGHAIESSGAYKTFLHGEAVALGMKAAGFIAVKKGVLQQSVQERILNLLAELGFKLTIPRSNPKDFLATMTHDKKVKDGTIRFVLPTNIGSVKLYDDITTDEILDAIDHIMEDT